MSSSTPTAKPSDSSNHQLDSLQSHLYTHLWPIHDSGSGNGDGKNEEEGDIWWSFKECVDGGLKNLEVLPIGEAVRKWACGGFFCRGASSRGGVSLDVSNVFAVVADCGFDPLVEGEACGTGGGL